MPNYVSTSSATTHCTDVFIYSFTLHVYMDIYTVSLYVFYDVYLIEWFINIWQRNYQWS